MKKEIKVATINLLPAHDLAVEAACSYFKTNREQLVRNSPNREHARKKGLLFFLLKDQCRLTDNDIAVLCGTTRQNVAYATARADVRKGLYLQSACDYKNIRGIFANLLEKQDQWLKQLTTRGNIKPSTTP